ncbi:D-alanyl-D-alanine carboxypeptidase [Prauserella shujinwangii]|uniref:D-alanyl-D-alanine carboxypeptidase n=1 Tax=Prauserella shujinwangii TaxID=1453103 RepID=A0A2T0LK88_9PSEU|nr:serine hydrolase domain-containing protein [Prauserella shujinwangii]PRX43275.1 D-alanyl-D-alanine carboxypeptidase [Prauserella shujinwangii]
MKRAAHRTVAILCCLAVLAGPLSGTATAAPPRWERIEAALDAAVAAGVPGVLAVTHGAAGSRGGASGVHDVRTGRPPRTEGLFRIGSVTKTFTAALVLRLVDEGRIGLDDDVRDHLPGLLPYREKITVRQLLQHTSGLPRDLPDELTWTSLPEIDRERFEHFTPARVVRVSTERPLRFAPGTSWAYSNVGYSVLALLVERVTGQRMEHALRDRVLRPLGLRRTVVPRDFPFVPGAALRGYERLYDPPRPLTDVTTYNHSRYFGSGSMLSTAKDVNRFFAALLGGDLLSAEMLAQMRRTVPARTPDGEYAGFDYGLGLARMPLDPLCPGGPVVWGHDGSLPGFGVWSMHTADGGTGITSVAGRKFTVPAYADITVMTSAFCAPAPSAPAAAGPSRS